VPGVLTIAGWPNGGKDGRDIRACGQPQSQTRRGRKSLGRRWAWPRHKVPAPQANGVAARLRPPPEIRAGGGQPQSQTRRGRKSLGRRWAWPRHKVPAPQANGVAARLRPPPEVRAGTVGRTEGTYGTEVPAGNHSRRRGGEGNRSDGDGHGVATKCPLRRQTESQRDSVHHRRFARARGVVAAQPLPPDTGGRGSSSFQEEYGRVRENRVVSG
jgi:hypothetical protein